MPGDGGEAKSTSRPRPWLLARWMPCSRLLLRQGRGWRSLQVRDPKHGTQAGLRQKHTAEEEESKGFGKGEAHHRLHGLVLAPIDAAAGSMARREQRNGELRMAAPGLGLVKVATEASRAAVHRRHPQLLVTTRLERRRRRRNRPWHGTRRARERRERWLGVAVAGSLPRVSCATRRRARCSQRVPRLCVAVRKQAGPGREKEGSMAAAGRERPRG